MDILRDMLIFIFRDSTALICNFGRLEHVNLYFAGLENVNFLFVGGVLENVNC